MTDLHNYNDDLMSVNAVDNPIVANSHTEMIWCGLKLLYARREKGVGEIGNLSCDPALQLAIECSKFSQCGGGELDRVAHRCRPDYNPSSFLICDQGIVGSFRRLRASSRSIRSSICSNSSTSSIGTTAAMGFF